MYIGPYLNIPNEISDIKRRDLVKQKCPLDLGARGNKSTAMQIRLSAYSNNRIYMSLSYAWSNVTQLAFIRNSRY